MKYLSNNIFWSQLPFCSKFINHLWWNFPSKLAIWSQIWTKIDCHCNFFMKNINFFKWNFWFYACDQKLLLVTFYVKSYLWAASWTGSNSSSPKTWVETVAVIVSCTELSILCNLNFSLSSCSLIEKSCNLQVNSSYS